MNLVPVALTQGFTSLLSRSLPGRTKRLIFLASFTARLKESTCLDSDTLNKLNKVMVLSSSDEAIKLPVQLSKAIWHGKSSYEICHEDIKQLVLSSERIQGIASRVINAMPAWLRYGDDKAIQQDLAKLLDNRNAVLGF